MVHTCMHTCSQMLTVHTGSEDVRFGDTKSDYYYYCRMSGAGGTRLDIRNAHLARADKMPAHQADGSLRRILPRIIGVERRNA